MSPLIGVAISLLPELLDVLRSLPKGSPASDQAQRKIEAAVTDATQAQSAPDAARKIQDDPQVRADLTAELARIAASVREAELADARDARASALKEDELADASTADARKLQEFLAASSPMLMWTPTVLSYMVVGGFLLLVAWLASGKVPVTKDTPENVLQIANILIGALAAAFATVLNFWLGSSLGSRGKDRLIEAQGITGIAPSPGPAPAPAPGGAPPAAPATPSPQGSAPAPESAPPAGGARAQTRPAPAAPEPAPASDADREPEADPQAAPRPGLFAQAMEELTTPHRHFPDGASWALTPDGVSIDGAPAMGTAGPPDTVRRIWRDFSDPIGAAARSCGAPAELIVATIATESGGRPDARRFEPKLNDESVGLMQTLTRTAAQALGRARVSAAELRDPATSILAGTSYIAQQSRSTHFDPPRVAAAYNAGSLRRDDDPRNRWRMLCFPRGTGAHIDRFVAFFNDAMRVSGEDGWGASGLVPSFAAQVAALKSGPRGAPAPAAPSPGAPARRPASPRDVPPPPAFPPLTTLAQRQALFGAFSFVPDPAPDNPERIRVTDDWEARNIVEVEIPISGFPGRPGPLRMRFHRKGEAQLVALWREWEKRGLIDRVLSFDGSYEPRFVRGSRTSLSNHAFGSAFDVNAAFNRLKFVPALVGERGSVRELVPIANDFGFYWGGHFRSRLDGMHFEIAELRPAAPAPERQPEQDELVAAAG
ncbi:transglycosylase SLT domain-containing protein [Methylocella sp.]|uniref:transglycosylase SLT domain-containing protein n=1 Tax=Methylocella sp. TaxID=1978226 RepID=UPI0035B2A27F